MLAIQPFKSLGMMLQGFPVNLASSVKNQLFSLAITCKNFPILPSLAVGGIRYRHTKRVNYKRALEFNPDEGGVQHHNFVYFPRHPGEVDPPYEPTKLLMVRRIRAMKRKPYWEIDLLKAFKITERRSIAIVKNTPEINANLYKIKHLIEIKPITFKYGFPQDPKQGFLKENGEVISYNLLESDKIELEEAEKQIDDLKKRSVDGPTLKHRLRRNWFSRW